MRDAHAPLFDPLQAAFAAGQEMYKAALLARINAGRTLRGRAPVGWPSVGTTPRRELHHDGAARLYRYIHDEEKAPRPSLLLVCSLINRPYILDLIEERSVVRRLLDGGIDVWLLDWGTPLPTDGRNGLGHYALGVLPRAVEVVRRANGRAPVHLLGYCMGGTLSLIALASGVVDAASLVALATPVDLHDGGTLSSWCRSPDLDPAVMTQVHKNIPPYVLQPAFKMLDPVGLATKLPQLEKKLDDDDFVRFFLAMETWLEDSVAFPGRAFAEWVGAYRENALVRGMLRVDGHRIDLARVTQPLLTIVAENDYICPPASSLALRGSAGSTDHELRIQPGGHIGLSTGKAAHHELWPAVARWIHERDAALHPTEMMQTHKKKRTGRTAKTKDGAQ